MAVLLVALAAFPALVLGDYMMTVTRNVAASSACSCSPDAAAASASTTYTPGCSSSPFGGGSTLVTCFNANFYKTTSFSTSNCSGTPGFSTNSTVGCSCYPANSGAFPYVSAISGLCVSSPNNVPSLDAISGSSISVSFRGPCPSSDKAVLPPLASATVINAGSSGCVLAGSSGPGSSTPSYVKETCGSWGSASAYYSDATCTVPAPPYVYIGAPAKTCSNNSYGSSSGVLCFSPSPAAPSSPFGATGMPRCKGAANPAPLPLPTLDCYTGVTSSVGSSTYFVAPTIGLSSSHSLSVACFAATISCAQQRTPTPMCESPNATIRVYGGAASAVSLLSIAELQGNSNGAVVGSAANLLSTSTLQAFSIGALPRDFLMCTSGHLCNSPASDACALAGPPYTSLTCAANSPPSANFAPAPIACYSNLGTPNATPVLQNAALPGALACFVTTLNCPYVLARLRMLNHAQFSAAQGNINVARLQALCAGVEGGVRLFSDNAAINILPPMVYLSIMSSPTACFRNSLNDVVLCTTAGCNSPAADACALAGAPLTLTATLAGLPASAADPATGKLTSAAVALLTSSLATAVQSSACATCSVRITRVVDTASGAVVHSSDSGARARALALGALAVTFATSGASAATLAGVAAAAAAPAFSQAAASALLATGGSAYAGATVFVPPPAAAPAAASAAPPALIGLVGLVGLVAVGLAVYCFCVKKAAATSKVVASPAPEVGVVASGPRPKHS